MALANATGPGREGRPAEWPLSKDFHWRGRTLWGMMAGGDRLALDGRSKAAVSVACLTRRQNLAANGAHAGHAIQSFVPGTLKEKFDAGSVAGLIRAAPASDADGGRRRWFAF